MKDKNQEQNTCGMCKCILPIIHKGARYCSNTNGEYYEEKKVSQNGRCSKFIPRVK